jgi:hypothetical protein
MKSYGSNNLRRFRRAIRDKVLIQEAAQLAGLSMAEAEAWVRDDTENPPPPEAYELLGTTPEGTNDMAKAEAVDGEYIRPDAEGAFSIYDKEIKGKKAIIAEKTGDLSDPYSRIKDNCNYPRKILDLIIFLEGQEDAKRDHLLLALSEGLKVRQLFMPRDLVTIADGEEATDIVPKGNKAKPKLATVPATH